MLRNRASRNCPGKLPSEHRVILVEMDNRAFVQRVLRTKIARLLPAASSCLIDKT